MKSTNVFQGFSLNIYEEEIGILEKLFSEKGVSKNLIDKENKILILNQKYVGYIKTPYRTIVINHKNSEVKFKNILQLYFFVYGHPKKAEDAAFGISDSLNFENIIHMFLDSLDTLFKKGLLTEYINEVEESEYLRGETDFIQSFKNIQLNSSDPFVNSVDILSHDNLLNKIIKKTLNKILRLQLTTDISKRVNRSLNNMKNVSDKFGPHEERNIIFNSKNSYYKETIYFAILILRELNISGIGKEKGESFLIDIDLLFENFVKKILFYYTDSNSFSDWSEKEHFANYFENGLEHYKYYLPDILYNYRISSKKATGVLDVKHKFNSIFSNADIYQILSYARILDSSKAILCYPSAKKKLPAHLILDNKDFQVEEINAVFINITWNSAIELQSIIRDFISEINDIL